MRHSRYVQGSGHYSRKFAPDGLPKEDFDFERDPSSPEALETGRKPPPGEL